MTTEALYEYCNRLCDVIKIRISDLRKEDVIVGSHKKWVIFNTRGFKFDHVILNLLVDSVDDLYVVEYDYRFCKYRNPTRHFVSERQACDCSTSTDYGRFLDKLYDKAKAIFFMSLEQRRIYKKMYKSVASKSNKDLIVLSSIFSSGDLDMIHKAGEGVAKIKDSIAYVDTESWVKGTRNALRWIEDRNRNILLSIKNLSYADTLAALAKADTLCYLPAGEDSCPRLCIEAALLNCNLETNEFVQHRTETPFQSKELIEAYYKNNKREDIFFRKLYE